MGELRELWQLRDENRRLKHVVADLTLDKQILREAVGKTWCAQQRPRRRRAVLQRAGGTLGLQPPTAYRRAGIFESRSVRTLNLR